MAAFPGPVVVGVDGSASATAAVRTAAREAARRGCELRVVHGFVWPLLRVPLGPSPLGPAEGGLRQQAQRLVDEAVAEARAVAPEITISGEVVEGSPAVVLLRQSREAALIVIGDRGLGGFAGLVLGSVATQVAEYAVCPVLVIRGEERPDKPVVVGVDGSELSALALEFAIEEAALRGVELVAVLAYRSPSARRRGDAASGQEADPVEAEQRALLADAVAAVRERHPEVPVRERLVSGDAGKVLVAESQNAQLLVVGARGCGGFKGLLLGSVSQTVLRHSASPVAIVRHRAHGEASAADAL